MRIEKILELNFDCNKVWKFIKSAHNFIKSGARCIDYEIVGRETLEINNDFSTAFQSFLLHFNAIYTSRFLWNDLAWNCLTARKRSIWSTFTYSGSNRVDAISRVFDCASFLSTYSIHELWAAFPRLLQYSVMHFGNILCSFVFVSLCRYFRPRKKIPNLCDSCYLWFLTFLFGVKLQEASTTEITTEIISSSRF